MRKKRNNTTSYEELLGSYYSESGRTRIKKKTTEVIAVISKSFNNGEILTQKRPGNNDEYVAQSSITNIDFEEYVVSTPVQTHENKSHIPSETEVSAVQEYMVDILNPLQTQTAASLSTETGTRENIAYDETPFATEHGYQASSNSLTAPPLANEDSFEADIQAILTGQKVFDPVTKKTLHKDQIGQQQATQQSTDPNREFKNEHAIFDRIAQSMQYANAYDLGTVEIENRLSQIDKEVDNTQNARVAKQQAKSMQQAVQNIKVGSAEFIADLDSIQSNATPPVSSATFSALNYFVPGIVAPIRQPSSMVCWATVATMMIGWKRNQSLSIADAVGSAGSTYLSKFLANQGLSAQEKTSFLQATGLSFEYPQSFSVDGYENLLRAFGPIWVTTDEDPSADFAIHARIIYGIQGDGTPQQTYLAIVDPAQGIQYNERFSDFIVKYEQETRDSGARWNGRIQIVHWPADTQPAMLQSTSSQQSSYYHNSATQLSNDSPLSYAKSVTGVVNNAVITDPFYRDLNEKQLLTNRSSGRVVHLGIDVSLSNAVGGDINDARRGLPVFAAIKTVIPVSDLNAVRTAGGTGMGLAGTGSANLLNAVVLAQPWADDGNAYGGVLGLACRYQYADNNSNQQTITLYIEFLHLITSRYPPKNGNGTVIPDTQWRAAHPGQVDFGPLMVNESVLPASSFTPGSFPLVGYLGATEFPHVHIQAAFAGGVHKYLRNDRFDPEVMIS